MREWAFDYGVRRDRFVIPRVWSFCLCALLVLAFAPISTLAGTPPPCNPNSSSYPCVYVVNTSGDNVSVIDTTTNTVVSSLAVGGLPQGLAITPNNAFVYVGDTHSDPTGTFGTLSVIDTAADSVLPTFVSGLRGTPSQVAIAPSGTFAYVTGVGSNAGFVDVVDTSKNQVIPGGITGLANPSGVVFTPSGAFAYVADSCGMLACADVFDTSTHTMIGTITIPGTLVSPLASVAVSPDGSLVCMTVSTSAGNLELAFISTSNNTFLNTLKIADAAASSDHGLGVTPGGILYVSDQPTAQRIGPGFVFPVALSTQTLGTAIQVGAGLDVQAPGVALGTNGAFLYATNAADDTVSVINTATNSVTATVSVGKLPLHVAAMSLVPPTITTQPAGQTINSGETLTLSVAATGSAPLSYQWFQGLSGDTSTPIAGATSSQFTTPPLSVPTSYWVLVSNPAGSVDSNTATVTVNQPPACTLSLQGAAPPDFLTITAVVNCVDPQNLPLTTTIFWGDKSSTTTDGGSVTVSHTYGAQGIYQLMVTAMDTVELQAQVNADISLPQLPGPLTVFPGGSVSVTILLQGAPAGLNVTFECTTVTDSQGTVRQAADLGITCHSNPLTITLTGVPQPVPIVIQTTGVTSGAIVPSTQPGGFVFALWLPLPAIILLGAGLGVSRSRRRLDLQSAALGTALMLTTLFVSCSSGGFSAPAGGQATPPGNYQVTVVDQPVGQTSGFVQTSLIVPLTVLQGP